jgi:sensor histidine kinase regulating citrate/malate metabolism
MNDLHEANNRAIVAQEAEIERLRASNAAMLEALEETLIALSPNDGYTGIGADACKVLRAAIAKAKGVAS